MFRRFALTLLLTSAFVAPALAAPSKGGDMLKGGPVAKPLSAWLVGPAQPSQFDEKDNPAGKGCLMVTEFDNGMIVGIHARAAGIIGMTVDTKDPILGAAQKVGLNLGQDSYALQAVQSDPTTLAIDLKPAGGGQSVAERLTGLGNFRLLIDKTPVYFATTGFTDGLARLQTCMGSTMAVPVVVTGPNIMTKKVADVAIEQMEVMSSGNDTPLALAIPNLVPMGYKFVLDDVDPMTPISWQAGGDWVQVMRAALEPKDLKMTIKDRVIRVQQRTDDSDPVIDDQQKLDESQSADATAAPDGVWIAAAGEDLSSVLEAWGLMAGVNVKADLEGDLKLPHDVRYEGAFSDAVQKLLGQFSGRNKPVGVFNGAKMANAAPAPVSVSAPREMEKAWKPRPPSELKAMEKAAMPDRDITAPMEQMAPIAEPAKKQTAPSKKTASAKKTKVKTSGTWAALEGTSLRDVLEHWGKDAGVNIVWMARENYPLPADVKKKGAFAEAVMAVLEQYQGQGARPVAQLNSDPDTGEKALIVKTNRL